mmetsp:Transcript_13462/g.21026  ORF Transcript_13462/g.21026 Transcript_13462/m.21026 type:complete len:88 (-) Transcript_13462:524-787(-)
MERFNETGSLSLKSGLALLGFKIHGINSTTTHMQLLGRIELRFFLQASILLLRLFLTNHHTIIVSLVYQQHTAVSLWMMVESLVHYV